MKLTRILFAASALLIASGAALAAPIGFDWLNQQKAVASAQQNITPPKPAVTAPQTVQGIPRAISLTRLGINLPVADGFYNQKTGEWTLSDSSAFFATPTSPVNTSSGTTLIYGHATINIFGKLFTLRAGDIATITTDNGYVFSYAYMRREVVQPTDTSKIFADGQPQLILQTCSGIWSESRTFFYFSLSGYSKS